MPVKSMLVPDVEATAVAEVIEPPCRGWAKVIFWSVAIVIAVVGVAPVWITSVPVVSAVTLYAVVLVVLALIVDI
jgi:hypothetical protein